MTAPVPCESCKRLMSAASARCPHCGALQARAPAVARTITTNKPLRDVSPEEARALLAVSSARAGDDTPARGDEQNLLEWFFVPHPRSTGVWRTLEWGLTVLTLPATLAGGALAFFMWQRVKNARGIGGAAGAGRALAALGLTLLGTGLGMGSGLSSVAVVVVPGAAIVARELIRARGARKPTDLV